MGLVADGGIAKGPLRTSPPRLHVFARLACVACLHVRVAVGRPALITPWLMTPISGTIVVQLPSQDWPLNLFSNFLCMLRLRVRFRPLLH